MLERLFTSRTRVKILTLFMMNPHQDFFLREITRRTDENINSVRRELKNLEDLGLLKSNRQGNMKYFSIQTDYHIYPELRSIIMKTEGITKRLKETMSKIKGLEVAFIYGSFASAEASPQSDLDLFIIGEIDENHLLKNVSSLEEENKREINYVIYTKEDFYNELEKDNNFLINVINGDKIKIIGDLDVGETKKGGLH